MINDFLMFVILVGIFVGIFLFVFVYLKYKKILVDDNGYAVVIDAFSELDDINLIKSKNNLFSKYDISRRMVKLSSSTYDGNNLFSLSVAGLLSGYAICDSKYLKFLRKFGIKHIKVFSFSFILGILVSFFVNTEFDAKIGIFILLLVSFYQYLIDFINQEVICKINLDVRCMKCINMFFIINRVWFIIGLVEIVRLVVIIL